MCNCKNVLLCGRSPKLGYSQMLRTCTNMYMYVYSFVYYKYSFSLSCIIELLDVLLNVFVLVGCVGLPRVMLQVVNHICTSASS